MNFGGYDRESFGESVISICKVVVDVRWSFVIGWYFKVGDVVS